MSGLHRHIDSGRIEIATCAMQLRELAEVLNRPRIRKYIPEAQAEEFIDLLLDVVLMVEPEQGPPLCRDPKDDYLLYTAMAAKADYLVSGDNDLLSISSIGNTQIITYKDLDAVMNS